MKRNKCELIRDLIPLVKDETACADTVRLVERHLAVCEQCRHDYEHFSQGLPAAEHLYDMAGYRFIRKRIRRHRIALISIVAVIVLWGAMFTIDYVRAVANHPPLFALHSKTTAQSGLSFSTDVTVSSRDQWDNLYSYEQVGETTEYYGLGYKIILSRYDNGEIFSQVGTFFTQPQREYIDLKTQEMLMDIVSTNKNLDAFLAELEQNEGRQTQWTDETYITGISVLGHERDKDGAITVYYFEKSVKVDEENPVLLDREFFDEIDFTLQISKLELDGYVYRNEGSGTTIFQESSYMTYADRVAKEIPKKFQKRALSFAGSAAERELSVQTMKRYNQYVMMLMYEQNAAQLENS